MPVSHGARPWTPLRPHPGIRLRPTRPLWGRQAIGTLTQTTLLLFKAGALGASSTLVVLALTVESGAFSSKSSRFPVATTMKCSVRCVSGRGASCLPASSPRPSWSLLGCLGPDSLLGHGLSQAYHPQPHLGTSQSSWTPAYNMRTSPNYWFSLQPL